MNMETLFEEPKLSDHTLCKNCGHAKYTHVDHDECVVCGCIRYDARVRNPERGRDWLVQVEFFVKNRWVKGEARVRAQGQVGAVMKGLRQVKQNVLKPQMRVASTKITIVSMARAAAKGR
jgi:ribosomal protein L37E